jgi:hypothetical protein
MTGKGKGGERRWRMAVWGAAACLLLLPLVAMRFTEEANWDATDFIVAGALLAAACGAWELATRLTASRAYRAATLVAAASALLLVWMNLAVGIFGPESNPANLMFAGVLAVAGLGIAVARFRPRGMARALRGAAAAQMLVAAIALIAGMQGGSSPAEIIGLNGAFALLWLLSARLFLEAARERPASGSNG